MNDPTRPDSARTGAAAETDADQAADKAETEAVPDKAAHETVEEAVRTQLAKALGGARGVVEAAIPTIGFTVSWIVSKELRLSLGIGAGLALILLAVRLAQRSTVQFVLNSIFGIGIAALFALRSGKAEDAFLPGILYNAGYAAAMLVSIVVRWPLVGFIIGSVTGDPTAWHRDREIVRLCSRLTWLLLIPVSYASRSSTRSTSRGTWRGWAPRRSSWAGRCRSPPWPRWPGCWPAAVRRWSGALPHPERDCP